MKRLLIFLLLLANSIFIFNNFVNAEELPVNYAGASYEVDSIEENYLPYGVNHFRVQGKTSTSMSGYDADGFGGDTDLVVPGKLYAQQVNILEVPSNQTVKVTSWAILDGYKWSLTTVKGMINDYESKNPGWKVIAAINGDFFDISGNGNLPYQTSGAVVSNGEFYKTSTGGLVGFANDGSTNSLIGNKPAVRTDKMILSVYDEENNIIKDFPIDKINEAPSDGETAVYYAIYNSDKKIVPIEVPQDGYFVDKAIQALPNNAKDFYGLGVISSKTKKTISTGQFAIVTNNDEVNELLDLDVKIRTQYKFVGDYENINDISGAGTTIMIDGEDHPAGGINDRAPRTVIGRREDGTIIMAVIDGRQSSKGMFGVDRTEMGAIMSYYGAVEAFNLDGGGSSTMIIRKNGEFVVMNSPSDGRERTDANAILIVVKDPLVDVTENKITKNSIELNVNLGQLNNHDIKELYVTLNNETKKVENDKVAFTSLKSNTEYFYKIEYKNSDNEMFQIVTDGKYKTHKEEPSLEGVEIIDMGDKFYFKLNYIDVDNAANYAEAQLLINDKTSGTFYKGERTSSKEFFPSVDKITIVVYINLGDGNRTKIEHIITDFLIMYNFDGLLIKMMTTQNNYLNSIYK